MNESMLSPADVAVLSGNTGNGGNGFANGFGDASWIILFLIFAFAGWGRNGSGFGGFGGGSGVADNYVLATDFATIERKLDSISNGICDSTFALNNTMTNGFAGVQQTLCQGFSGINQNIVTNGYETRLATQGLSSQLADCCCGIKQQLADCCCTTQRAIDNVNYNMATNTCAITNAINTGVRDIVDNQNANYRAIHEELVANKLEMKNDRIAEQQNEINALRLRASQEAQNNYLISQLKPCPDPAYIVPNPNCCYNYGITGFGYGTNGCGCNNY